MEEEHGLNTTERRTGRFFISDARRYTNTHALQSAIIHHTCLFYHMLAHYFLETRNRRPCIGEARRPSLLGKITDSLRAWKPFDLESIVWRNIGFSCALTSKYGSSTVAACPEVISLASRDCEQPTTLTFLSCKWVFIRIRDRPSRVSQAVARCLSLDLL